MQTVGAERPVRPLGFYLTSRMVLFVCFSVSNKVVLWVIAVATGWPPEQDWARWILGVSVAAILGALVGGWEYRHGRDWFPWLSRMSLFKRSGVKPS